MCACSMCTAGTMVGMKSSNSNSSVRCYLLECHREWYFFLSLPLAHLRIHFHFYFKQKVILLVKWGLNPPSYHQNSPKGAHVIEIYSHQGDLMKQEMKCVRFMSDYREQSPTTKPSLDGDPSQTQNTLQAILAFSSHLSLSEKKLGD